MEDIHIVTILKEHRNLIGLIREIVVHILKALHVSITKTNGITTDEGSEITEDDIKILKRFLGVNYVNDNANEKGGE